MKRVVFLDYDGVVNRRMWTQVAGRWVCRFGYPEDGAVNDPQAVQWVSEFCETYGYAIVVTSTWRKYPEWETCLRAAGLRESIPILGATSLPTRDRGREIADYLAEHPDIGAYLVFDDETSLTEGKDGCDHRDRLVLCRAERGFGEEEYARAVAIHEKIGMETDSEWNTQKN